jgi:hypothetical protein
LRRYDDLGFLYTVGRSAGYRTVGIRERIAQRDGT